GAAVEEPTRRRRRLDACDAREPARRGRLRDDDGDAGGAAPALVARRADVGLVPDRRGPGAFLDRRRVEGILRRVEAAPAVDVALGAGIVRPRRGGLGPCRAIVREGIHPGGLTLQRAPAAARILEHAHVVEGGLSGVEAWILPVRAEARGPAAGRLAGLGIDAGPVGGFARDVED